MFLVPTVPNRPMRTTTCRRRLSKRGADRSSEARNLALSPFDDKPFLFLALASIRAIIHACSSLACLCSSAPMAAPLRCLFPRPPDFPIGVVSSGRIPFLILHEVCVLWGRPSPSCPLMRLLPPTAGRCVPIPFFFRKRLAPSFFPRLELASAWTNGSESLNEDRCSFLSPLSRPRVPTTASPPRPDVVPSGRELSMFTGSTRFILYALISLHFVNTLIALRFP